MNAPEIDPATLALYKELMAKVCADAECEMKKRMQSMSAGDRTKLNRLLKNIEVLGDVGKAAAMSRVGRTLLDKWMNTPGISWKINAAFNEAQLRAHGGENRARACLT